MSAKGSGRKIRPPDSRTDTPNDCGRLGRNEKTSLLAIIFFSVLIRMVFFAELSAGPAFWLHRGAHTDMAFFDAWARDIADGDWLSQNAGHPYHIWNKRIAEEYFKKHPAELEIITNDNPGAIPGHALWNKWYGERNFHQEPLYPYLIALTYKVAGDDPRWVFVWQMALGVLTNMLVYLVTLRYFGARAAVFAGTLAVLCSPLLFYEAVLLRASSITFTGMGLLYLYGNAAENGKQRSWFFLGLAFGLAMLLKTTFLLFLFFIAALTLKAGENKTSPLHHVLVMMAGAAIAMAPAMARNAYIGVGPLSMSSVGAITFACVNTEDYSTSLSSAFPCSLRYVPEIMRESGGGFANTAVLTMKTHENTIGYARQMFSKFLDIWRWDERPNNASFYFFRLHSDILRYLPVTFFILAPLSAIGLIAAVPMTRHLAPLYMIAVVAAAPMIVFYPTSRFRAPLIAALMPFAAFALVKIFGYARSRPAAALGIALAFSLYSLLPYHKPVTLGSDYAIAYYEYYSPMIENAVTKDDYSRAKEIFHEVLRVEPPFGPDYIPQNMEEYKTAILFSKVRDNYAVMLEKVDDDAGAKHQKTRAKELYEAAKRARGRR